MVEDHEAPSVAYDKRPAGRALPRHEDSRALEREPRPSCVWNFTRTERVEGEWGQFPRGFLDWVFRELDSPRLALHVCSGSLPSDVWGYRVDVRATRRPDVVADGRRLPFGDEKFDGVLVDPPYTVEYARDLYGTEYPRPSHLLAEACRVTRPGGLFALLHFVVANPPKGSTLERVVGIVQGCGYRIRALTVYRRDQASLF